MFGKKKKNYDLTYENLAIPEIHTHEAPEQEQTAQAEEKHEKETHKPGGLRQRSNPRGTYQKEIMSGNCHISARKVDMWQFWVCEGEKIGKKREKGVW